MQTDAIQSAMQPLMKLVQSNMDLMQKYAFSPEVTNQAMNDAQKLFQQAQESASKLVQSNAFASLTQGMMKNFTEFCTDAGQSASAAFSQGQAALMQQAEEATNKVIDATQANAKRVRQAA